MTKQTELRLMLNSLSRAVRYGDEHTARVLQNEIVATAFPVKITVNK